jgi:Ca-activated chloride channel family protein
MTDFHFLRPWWLLAAVPLAALLFAWHRRRSLGGDWRDYCDPALLPHILIGTPTRASRLALWLAGLAGMLAVLALAGPTWERLPAPVFRNLAPLVVVLDLSMAMDSADLKPNRVGRARFKIEDILRARKDGQTALVVYAGDAFTVTPLTDDAATIAAQLGALSPRLMPAQGTRADLGLDMAGQLLKQAGLTAGDVLLVSSGDDAAGAEGAAARLRAQGYRVSVLGVGTAEGGPIPRPGGGFLKDDQGRIAIPQLDAKNLQAIATAGGGLYRPIESGSGDLNALLGFVDRRADGAQQSGDTVHLEQWRDAGYWLLPLLLPLAALGFRRGWLGVALLCVLAPVPRPADAIEWRDLWLTPDQQAQRALQAGDAKQAAERFRDPAWKAAAEYKAGDYGQAAKDLAKLDTAAGQYNRGNALANQGALEDALKAYDRALQLDPKNEDAAYNRKLVEEALRRQQEQQQQKQDQKEQKQDQKDRQEGQDQGQQQQPRQGGKDGEQQPQNQNQTGDQKQQQKSDGQNEPSSSEQKQGAEQQDGQDQEQAGEDSKGRKPGEQKPSQAEQQAAQPAGKDGQGKEEKGEPQPVPGEAAEQDDPQKPDNGPESEARSETRQAEEQWLRRIPDDPGGLLRRKFDYQYRQRQRQNVQRNEW